MAKKECTDIRDKFSDYIDELLPESEMADLEMHMKKCPSCTKELAAFNKTVQALRNLPRYTAHTNIVVKINDRIEKNKRWWQRINTKAFKGSLGTISAIIICVIGYQLYTGSNVSGLFKAGQSNAAATKTNKDTSVNLKAAGEKKRASKEMPAAPKPLKSESLYAGKMHQSLADGAAANGRDKAGTSMEFFAKQEEMLRDGQTVKEQQQDYKRKDAGLAAGAASDLLAKNAVPAAASVSAPMKMLTADSAFEQKGLFCANSIKENIVITEQAEFKNFWLKSFSNLPEPVIDFKKEMLIAAFLGDQETEPKDVTIKEIVKANNILTVKIALTPILNTDTSGKKLSPYHIRAIRKSSLSVEFIVE